MVSLPGKYNRGEEELCRVFEMALDAYRRQSWEEAIDLFNNSSRLRPEDGPSLFYLDLCRRYRATPPEEDWTGMVAMAEK
jgi:adenylate cyclase